MSTCVMNVVNMATKNVVADLTKGEKLDGTNYDMWHKKIQYLLNEQEVLETLTNVMMRPENENTTQHCRDLEAYESWVKKDRWAVFQFSSLIITLFRVSRTSYSLSRY